MNDLSGHFPSEQLHGSVSNFLHCMSCKTCFVSVYQHLTAAQPPSCTTPQLINPQQA